MKKICFFLLFICFTTLIFSQERDRYFDAPFGGGGGFTPGWIFPNFDELNNQLVQFNVPKLSNSGLFTTGGSGFVYIGVIKNLRVGGMGFGGSKSVSAIYYPPYITLLPTPNNGEKREVDYSIGGGGLTVEYTLPFVRNFGISVGGIIGGGSININVYKNTSDISWNNLWDQANSSTSTDYARQLKDTYWFFTPTLNVDIPLYRFVVLRVGGGYQLTFADSWKIDNDRNLTNVPSDLNGNAFFIQTGIFLGFFSF
jgi:hypothetical protein